MAKVKLSSPWVTYYREMQAFFAEDPDVTILYDEDEMEVKVLVAGGVKADALTHLLVPEQEFGNVKLKITVIPANGKPTPKALLSEEAPHYLAVRFNEALNSNALFAYTRVVDGLLTFDATYVVFEKKVVQYFSDDLGDLNGFESTLAETIARDIFVQRNGLFFCTSIDDSAD